MMPVPLESYLRLMNITPGLLATTVVTTKHRMIEVCDLCHPLSPRIFLHVWPQIGALNEPLYHLWMIAVPVLLSHSKTE